MTVRAAADDGGLPLEEWKRIDSVCSRFETAWANGERPDPATFLAGVDGPGRDRLFRELLAIDLESRRSQGELPEAPEYRDRFPGHLDAINETFASLAENGRTLTSAGNRLLRSHVSGGNGTRFGKAGEDLAPAELNTVVMSGLRSAGYEVLGELGRGGMGVVYLARKVALNRLCALKMILAGAHASTVAQARFRGEAEAIARLRHPDIVQIYHVGEVEGLPFLELEYLAGGGLDQALNGSPKPPAAAGALVEITARAIAKAHQLGIVHRDLKPANILLDENGRPKVADFGLAKILGSEGGLTKTSAVLGSPSYMAPEQAEGDSSKIGSRTDVYALGAILYELLTGRPPFRAATAFETLAQVKSADPVPPTRIQPGMPREIETICLKCLEKQPARRYASALELAQDLRRFLDGEPIHAHDPPIWLLLWKQARRRPALSAALLVTAAAVVVLIGGSLHYNARLSESVLKAQAAEKAALKERNLTMNALNELVFGVQDRLGKTAATRTARKGLLEKALDGLEQVARDAEASAPDLGRAVAHQKLGDIFRQVGRNPEAGRQYGFARELADRLASGKPHDPEIRECLARSHTGLGELSLNANRTKEAVEHFRQAVLLTEQPALEDPDKAQARAALLEAYFRLGRAYGFDRDIEQGEVWFRKMESLATRWIAQEPTNVLARDQLSTSHRKIADMRKLAGDDVGARAEYVKAVDLSRELLMAEPANNDVKLHLALALDDQGMTLSRLGSLDQAAALERQAQQLFEQLVKADPEDIDNQLRLHQTEFNAGCVAMDRLDLHAAKALLRQALEGIETLDREGTLDGRPRDRAQLLPAFKQELAMCEAIAAMPGDLKTIITIRPPAVYRALRIATGQHASAGRTGDFSRAAAALCEMDAAGPDRLYQLARCTAWCAGRIDQGIGDSSETSDGLRSLRERLVDRAAAALEAAVRAGLPYANRFDVDEFLNSIREQAGFRKLSESRRTARSGSGTSPNLDGRSATTRTQRP
jgi:tetratricopeptide (TPR) repeat protein